MELVELKENSVPTEQPEGLIPENKIYYTIQDRLHKTDKELEWIKSDILKSTEKNTK